MKKIIILVAIFGYTFLYQAKAQENLIALKFADDIAQKMADSLLLSSEQKMQIYNINMDLYKQKKQLRESKPQPATLEFDLQQIENKRDSLYKVVLLEEKFKLYKLKKCVLFIVD